MNGGTSGGSPGSEKSTSGASGRPVALDRLLQPRLAQHVAVAKRGESGRRHLEHHRGLPRGDARQIDQEGQAGGAAGQRGHAADPRAGTPVGHPPPDPVPQLSQQCLVGLAAAITSPPVPKTTIF